MTDTLENKIDELLEDAYLGLYAHDPETGAFVPMDDRHLVLHNDLKKSIKTLINQAVLDELNEARKWSTKAESADQVWQQIQDRIKSLTNTIEESDQHA